MKLDMMLSLRDIYIWLVVRTLSNNCDGFFMWKNLRFNLTSKNFINVPQDPTSNILFLKF